jgi:hypothetical protein
VLILNFASDLRNPTSEIRHNPAYWQERVRENAVRMVSV